MLITFPLNQNIHFFNDLEKLDRLDDKKTKTRKIIMYHKASELHSELVEIYFYEYNDFSDTKRKNMNSKCDPANLTLDAYDYEEWF